MSNYSRNVHTQRQAVIDYDRQFQEDLERAQALSLESLALEKFKLQKQQLEYSNHVRVPPVQQQQDTNPCSSNVSETDCNAQTGDKYVAFRFFNHLRFLAINFNVVARKRFQLRSRPRPGGSQPKNTAIIAPPPPIPCRRNSTTSGGPNVSGTDLINFTSPIKQDNHLDEYCTATPPPPPP